MHILSMQQRFASFPWKPTEKDSNSLYHFDTISFDSSIMVNCILPKFLSSSLIARILSDSPKQEQKEEERKIQKILCAITLTTFYSQVMTRRHHLIRVINATTSAFVRYKGSSTLHGKKN